MKKLLVGLTPLLILALAFPALAVNQSRKPATAPPGIERGVFVDYGYSSPPWYPPEEETESYRWAPRIYWASLPVSVTAYTGDQPSSLDTFEAIEAGFTAWDDETGTSLYSSITEDSGSGPEVALDSENTVQWAIIDGPGGIIGVTYYWYYTATKEMVEFDIVLDSDDSWSLTGGSGTFSVQGVSAHEIGHTLVLQDLRSPKDGALTMHAYTWLGDTLKNDLGLGDVLGVKAIYGE